MPNYVVEIEWPLSGNDVGQSFWPSAVVRDEDDIGIPPPANTHKVTFELYYTPNSTTNTLKSGPTDSNPAPFDPSTQPTVTSASAMTTDTTGTHKLVAILYDVSGTAPVQIDSDEELNLNVTATGPERRELGEIIIEE
ncbi:MAG: hypothetical protein KF873_11540 [Gemmataceae bacterium]|nr:hypothetical protein [Planctomycetia bacterium]MBX3399368.1 hypothetical protein [Gemmataceae bacterium]